MDIVGVALMSPVVASALSLIVFALLKLMRFDRPGFKALVVGSLVMASICAGLALVYTFAHMIWFEATTGISAGNGPLWWIFIGGPLSVTFGILVTSVSWAAGWPRQGWDSLVKRRTLRVHTPN